MSTTAPPPPVPAAPARPEQARLDRSLVRGIAWTGAAKWGSQVLTWASTLAVARLLTPEDYGLVGMAAVFTGLLTLLGEMGLGSAVVTLRGLDEAQVRQLHTLSLLLGVASLAAACAAAVPLGRFFGAPELPPVVAALGVGFVVAGLRTVPESLMQKELRFRSLALVEGAGAAVTAAATVAFAAAGLGHWTLVLGTLLGGVLQAAPALALRPVGLALPRAAALRPALALGGHVLGARLAWYVYSNADFLVVGRALGERALGHYSFAWSLASVPIGKVSALILRVTPAHFSAVQDDPAALRRYLLSLTEALALVTFPATVGMALVADDLVRVALGEKWMAAAPILRLLAFYASLRSITPLLPQVLTVTGDARFAMRNAAAAAVVLPLAFVAGSRWGVSGVAVAWMVAHPLCILPLFVRVFRRLGVSWGHYAAALRPALAGCVAMAAAVLATGPLTAPIPGWTALLAQVAAGAAAYAATVLAFHRDRLRAFRATLAAARSG